MKIIIFIITILRWIQDNVYFKTNRCFFKKKHECHNGLWIIILIIKYNVYKIKFKSYIYYFLFYFIILFYFILFFLLFMIKIIKKKYDFS